MMLAKDSEPRIEKLVSILGKEKGIPIISKGEKQGML